MPKQRGIPGVSKKEQRQYEHIKTSAQRTGRYGKRAKEVAARTVLKQHKKKGHKTGHRDRQLRHHEEASAARVWSSENILLLPLFDACHAEGFHNRIVKVTLEISEISMQP